MADVYVRTVWGLEYYVSGVMAQNGATEARAQRSPTGSKESGEVRVFFYRRTKVTAKAPAGYLIPCGMDIFSGHSMHWVHVSPKHVDESAIDDPELKTNG